MFKESVYRRRRQRLSELVPEGIVLFCGNVDSPFNSADNCYRFRQDSNFLYFCGLDEPGLALLLDLDEGGATLFGEDPSVEDMVWTGPLPSLAERAQQAGIATSAPLSGLANLLQQKLAAGRTLHLLPSCRTDTRMFQARLLGLAEADLSAHISPALIQAVVCLRSVKEAEEIAELDQAADLGYEIHTAAMRMAVPGLHEWAIAGEIEAIAARAGSMLSFPPIVTVHGEILHNHKRDNLLREGDLLLVDAGVESPLHYASDHTRTTPVGIGFSSVQRDIFQIVCSCLEQGLELVRPGVAFRDIHLSVCQALAAALGELGLMRGDPAAAAAAGAHALFMPCGLGHMLGLDVHDMEELGEDFVGYDGQYQRSSLFGTRSLRLGRQLQTGFVITIEPGIYFIPPLIDLWRAERRHAEFINYAEVDKFRHFGGVRLEDEVLVTTTGNRLLGTTGRIPLSF